MADRKPFFDAVRVKPFGGVMLQTQVDGINVIMDEWQRRKLTDKRWLAYILATVFHETARTMRPIEEYGRGKGRAYGKADIETGKTYYGRGYVQLTWKDNYAKFAKKYDLDLVWRPDLALQPAIAVRILFDGMIEGTFTGKKLADFFTPTASGWENARRIVNGTDKAALIADYARAFYEALGRLETAIPPPPDIVPPKPTTAPPRGFFHALGKLVEALLSIFKKRG